MPTQNVACIFDSYRTSGGAVVEDSTSMNIINRQDGFLQFNMPTLDEVYISSAKLYLYLINKGAGASVTPTLYNVNYSIQGKSGNEYSVLMDTTKIAEANEKYSPEKPEILEYNAWIPIDITNLVIGYLGKNYYTLGLIGGVTTTGSAYAARVGTIERGYPARIEIEYEYATPFKPTIIYPLGEAVSNTGTLTFSWIYNTSGNGNQTKFDLQWKMQANTAWNNVSQATENTQYSMNANAFINGIVEWRVRTYNKHNMASEWGTSQFVVVGKPANPVISGAKNDALTEVTWNANKSEESAARIQIKRNGVVIYDSGIIPAGIEDAYRPDIILDNGNYVAVLAISNMYGMWSNEITYPFTINNNKPEIYGLRLSSGGDYIKLIYTGTTGAEYFIYRAEGEDDFIPIARTSDTEYHDYAVKADMRYRYFVRCYKQAYSDTSIMDINIKYKGFFFSSVSDMEKRVNLLHHNSEQFLPFKKTIEHNNALVLYTGRKKPVKESGIYTEKTISIDAFITLKSGKVLEEIYNENGVFCLRNKNDVIYCDISGISESMTFFNKGYIVGLTFTEVDHEERVRFNE